MKKLKKVELSPKILSSPLFTYIIKGRNDPLPISQGALSTLHPRFRSYPTLWVSHKTLRASSAPFPAPRVSHKSLRASFTAFHALRVPNNTFRASSASFPAPRVLYDILKAGKPHIPCPRSPPTYYLRHKKPYPSSSDTGHLTRCAIHWTIRRD